MKKLLSALVAAMFAFGTVSVFLASPASAQDKGDKMGKMEKKKEGKKDGKKKGGKKKMEKKGEDKK